MRQPYYVKRPYRFAAQGILLALLGVGGGTGISHLFDLRRAAAQQSLPALQTTAGATTCASVLNLTFATGTLSCSGATATFTPAAGGVTSVTATSPVASSGGTTPDISIVSNPTFTGDVSATGFLGTYLRRSTTGTLGLGNDTNTNAVTIGNTTGNPNFTFTGSGSLLTGGIIDRSTAAALSLGTSSATSVAIGSSGITTTVNGALAVNGNTTLGNAAADTVTFTGVIAGSPSFQLEANHTLNVAASTTASTAGGNLTIAAGAGATTAVGGNLVLNSGNGASAAPGSITIDTGTGSSTASIDIGGTNGGSLNLSRSGQATAVAGTFAANGNTTIGDAATDTLGITAVITGNASFQREVNHTLNVAASTTAATVGGNLTVQAGAGNGAVGGNLNLYSGSAGAPNNAGNVDIDTADTGGAGTISIGTTYGGALGLSRSGQTTTVNGPLRASVSLLATNLLISATAPTISSGFGTTPSISANNGTGAFRVNVGTGGTASSGVIGLPTATTGWNCQCDDLTTQSSTVFLCKQTASSTTTATVGNFDAAGAAAAWVASDILAVSCSAL